jgi:hypothetical protein
VASDRPVPPPGPCKPVQQDGVDAAGGQMCRLGVGTVFPPVRQSRRDR